MGGTLLDAWALLKSYRPRRRRGWTARGGRNPELDFRGKRRSWETHASLADPEALLVRKGASQEAKLSFMGHLLTENRDGLVMDGELTQADGYAER